MAGTPERSEADPGDESSEREELRTIAFRMREIQRLLSARVEQENRRLEAEGIDPVDTARFQRAVESTDTPDQ